MNLAEFFPDLDPAKIAELTDYNKDLDVLASKKISIQFNNKGKDHAILVMSKIFSCSHKNVKIFARDFNGEISDNRLYLNNLDAFLNKSKDNTVQVIFEKDPNPKSKALELLRNKKIKNPKQVILKRATEKQIESFKTYLVNEEGMINFTIGDNESGVFDKYRCETDTSKFIAVLNFDDQKFCATLNKLYKILETDSIPI